jgi:tetratricopeptide (TPR) repeat protein
VALAAGLGIAGLCLFLAVQAHDRARVWRAGALVMADAARNYPEGRAALLIRAQGAARAGDVDGAVAALEQLQRRGYNRLEALLNDPAYAPLRGSPRFQAVLADMASYWIALISVKADPTQLDLHLLGVSYHVRGQTRDAIAVLERALALEGPETEQIRKNLAELRRLDRLGSQRARQP